jgi:hypothetical protein
VAQASLKAGALKQPYDAEEISYAVGVDAALSVARRLERRLRSAERLLAALETDKYGSIYVTHYGFEKWREQLLAHLEAAGRLDYE